MSLPWYVFTVVVFNIRCLDIFTESYTHFCLRRLSCDRAHGSILRTLDARVRHNLIQMVSNCRLCYWAHIARVGLQHVGVVGWEDCGSGANDGAEGVVHLLCFRLLDVVLEDGARSRRGGSAGHGRVRCEVVVVVCRRAYHGTLRVC
jgi:hypothetical protein